MTNSSHSYKVARMKAENLKKKHEDSPHLTVCHLDHNLSCQSPQTGSQQHGHLQQALWQTPEKNYSSLLHLSLL